MVMLSACYFSTFYSTTYFSYHSYYLLHFQIKSKKSPDTLSSVRKGDQEKVLHQPFPSGLGNSKQSNRQIVKTYFQFNFHLSSNVIIKHSKLLQLQILSLDTFCVPKSFGHTALLALILEFQVSIARSVHPGSLKFLHSTNLPRNLPWHISHSMESIELVEVSSFKNSQGGENTGKIPKAEHIPLPEISPSDVPR